MKKLYRTYKECLGCNGISPGGNTLHHVKTRGAGGTDDPWNLMPLCTKHHNEVHTKGLNTFAQDNFRVHEWLKENGWTFFEPAWKWIRIKKENEDASLQR